MQDSRILSTFGERKTPPQPRQAPPVLVFDACQVGVILRAVLYVEAVIGVGLMYLTADMAEWLARVALVTGGALPATLLWLVLACALKRLLARLNWPLQAAAGVTLGALAGLCACGTLALLGFAAAPPWLLRQRDEFLV
ncbi:MAG: sensor histidine kinase, partial [Burkholderiales bacterium]|nr:sensor histidine kinase [Burkholderiales bacterium]